MLCLAASAKDIDLAVSAARKAFQTSWGKNVTGFERSRLINKLADLIERDAQELGELESLNNGKPVRIARYHRIVIFFPSYPIEHRSKGL
jgi:aldehyde dehydrogenase (NAD+)